MTIPHIDGFDITTWVRETSTATIWRATQRSLDRPVLLHVLKPNVAPEVREAFEANARLVARIGAPGLVGVYDVSTTSESYPFAILDAFDGQSLRDALSANGPFSQKRIIPIARSIAETLSVAWNQHRYVHRNLKPEEIFLLRDGSVRIADFASATYVAPDGLLADRSGEVVGTPSFMPPEQADARPTMDTHADMYALGAILYLLATGRTPFEEYASDPLRVLQILPFGTLSSPRDENLSITPGFESVLARLLMKNPQDRYGSWGGLIQDLDSIAAGKPPAIAKAFVASGKPTLTPSVRHPGTSTFPPPSAPDESIIHPPAPKAPGFAPVLWLLLLIALAALGAWRWQHPETSLQEVLARFRAPASETPAADPAPESDLTPLPALPEPTDGPTEETSLAEAPAVPPADTVLAETRPAYPESLPVDSPSMPPSAYAPPSSSEPAPTATPSAAELDAAFLRSFVGAVRKGSDTNLLAVLKKWNATNPDEATAAAKTLLSCGWPNDRLGARLMNLYGKPISFLYHQQEVTVIPEAYVDGKLTGRFVQKDGTSRTVTFPLSELDAKTRLALYRKGAPAGLSTEPDNHAADALYALAAGDLPSFRASIALSGGFSPIFWRISDAIAAREKAAGSASEP